MSGPKHRNRHETRLIAAAHIALTRLRRLRAAHGRRLHDAAPMARFRAPASGAVFHIVGTGASLNDLRPRDWRAIAAGRSVSVNMAILAPVAFDLCSFEFMPNAFLGGTVAECLRGRGGQGLLWVQDRPQHRSPHLDALAAEFPMHRYAPVDVSTGGRADVLRRVWLAEMRGHVIERPDPRLCYALIGSVARVVLLGVSLGYRRICLSGFDQNANPYFWQEGRMPGGVPRWHDESGVYAAQPRSGIVQAAGLSLLAFLRILSEAEGVAFSVIDPARRSALSGALPQHDT